MTDRDAAAAASPGRPPDSKPPLAPWKRRERRIGRAEPRGEDEDVELVSCAVDGLEAVGEDAADPPRLERDVRPRHRGVEIIGKQEALASDAVGGSEARAELRVSHLKAQV